MEKVEFDIAKSNRVLSNKHNHYHKFLLNILNMKVQRKVQIHHLENHSHLYIAFHYHTCDEDQQHDHIRA